MVLRYRSCWLKSYLSTRKIPFACTYLPGKGKIHIFWIVYLVSLISYVVILTSLAYDLLLNPSNFLYFYAIIFILFLMIRFVQNRFFLKKADIKPADNVYNGITNKISMRCRGGRTVQAAACRAALCGFNSHPRLPNNRRFLGNEPELRFSDFLLFCVSFCVSLCINLLYSSGSFSYLPR